jgi:hypothetical protein
VSQAESINKIIPKTAKIVIDAPRNVDTMTTKSETFWPGKLGAETTMTLQKYPQLKKVFVPKHQGVYLTWQDGSECFIPNGNIKSMVFESE